MTPELVYLLLLAVGVLITVFVGHRVKREGDARARGWQSLVQTPSDLSLGPSYVWVRAPTGQTVDLGNSQESGNRPSGSPELSSNGAVLQIEDGPLVRLQAGVPIKVHGLPGAKRNLLDTTTTETGGVTQRYSFEVSPQSCFWILGVLAERSATGPFRSDEAIEMLPLDGRHEVRGDLPSYQFGKGLWILGITGAIMSCPALPLFAEWAVAAPWLALGLILIGLAVERAWCLPALPPRRGSPTSPPR